MEVKNKHAYITTQRILNKFIEINASVGCMFWFWYYVYFNTNYQLLIRFLVLVEIELKHFLLNSACPPSFQTFQRSGNWMGFSQEFWMTWKRFLIDSLKLSMPLCPPTFVNFTVHNEQFKQYKRRKKSIFSKFLSAKTFIKFLINKKWNSFLKSGIKTTNRIKENLKFGLCNEFIRCFHKFGFPILLRT